MTGGFTNLNLPIGPRASCPALLLPWVTGTYFVVSEASHYQDAACTIAAGPGDPVRVSVMPNGERFDVCGVVLSADRKSLNHVGHPG